MKVQIDVITGFLGAGKTRFINGILKNKLLSKQRVVILQRELGETEINSEFVKDENIYVKCVHKGIAFDGSYIREIVKKYHPDRIIIEHNGTESLDALLDVLYSGAARKSCTVVQIIHIIDAGTHDIFMNNMGEMLIEQISGSDLIVINNAAELSERSLCAMEKSLKAINKTAEIVENTDNVGNGEGVSSPGKTVKHKQRSDMLFTAFLIFAVLYVMFSIARSIDFAAESINLSWLPVLNTVFLSILIQAFPFILLGVLISSLIQVFVSNETIVRLFPREKGFGFIAAIFGGLLFPVCDCAIVPIAAGLVKKGVPYPTAITFMLAAPIVNPLVIVSTIYAFPGQPFIVVLRLYLGIAIALAVGLILPVFSEENSVLLTTVNRTACRCGYCENMTSAKGLWDKAGAAFRHAGAEFFEVGRFIVIGAFLSSIVQTLLPKDILVKMGGGNTASLVIMMLAAFVLSVCSTSDAFIARTFVNRFSMSAVMGFMVLGPMIDIKNVLMLLGNFKKRFVIKLVLILFGTSFVILSIGSVLFLGG